MWKNKKEDEESEPDHGESKEISASAVISGTPSDIDSSNDATGGITIKSEESEQLVDMVTNLIVKRVRAEVNNVAWRDAVHNWVFSNLNIEAEKLAYSDISLLVGETELNALRDTLL